MNYKKLIYWLIDNTKINNEKSITNTELKELFLKDYPEYKTKADNVISFKIGGILNLIYDSELIKTKDESGTYYNIEIAEN